MNIIRTRNHIKIQLQANLRFFVVRELGDVVSGAKQTEFLGGYPDEADGVVDAEFGELEGGFEEADGAAAVVVVAGPGVDGVGVRG